MESYQTPHYTGAVWSSELKSGTAYRISLDMNKIKDIEPDSYGNILFSISKRKEPHPQLKTTHNIYINGDPQNYMGDRYAILNLSLNKTQLSDLQSEKGYCDIIALPLSPEAKQNDRAKASYIVAQNISLKEKDNSVKGIPIGKAWDIFHKVEKGGKPNSKNNGDNLEGKQYVGSGLATDASGIKYINVLLDFEKIKNLEAAKEIIYINGATRKGRENEFSIYHSTSKNDKWAQFTIALDRAKTLALTPSEHGHLCISISNKKETSVSKDNANLNVKSNNLANGSGNGENQYLGKGWSKENMYWLYERSDEIDQVITIEKTREMEGKGLTNKGLHIFQTLKNVPSNGQTIDSIPDTSNSYFLKDSLVFHEKVENSILPTNGYPFSEFVRNYESLKENYATSTFYNIGSLPHKEMDIFIKNSPARIEAEIEEKKKTYLRNDQEPDSKIMSGNKENKIVQEILDSDSPKISKGRSMKL